MKTIQITDQEARKLYETSNDEWKGILERHYGKEFFSQDVNDRIDGWEDMMAETGRPDVPAFIDLPEDLRDHFQKYYRVVIMNEAYNQGEKMDIYNSDIYRYFAWFRTNGSASGFACCGLRLLGCACGFRCPPCFKKQEVGKDCRY